MTTYYIIRKREGEDMFKIFQRTQGGDLIPHNGGRNYDTKQLNQFITSKQHYCTIELEQKKTLEDRVQ